MIESKQSECSVVMKENSGRRRFIRGAGLAVPVAMTISARSALACTCSTVSAHASIQLAHSHNSTTDVNIACSGMSPDSYKSLTSWSGISFGGDFFTAVFPDSALPANATMKQVLKNTVPGVTTSSWQRMFAAAYLNSKNGKVSTAFYTINEDLKPMWNNGPSNTYAPVPGALWGKTEIQTYLTDTWT